MGKYNMEIGAQLYTVRDYTQNLDDFAKTLEKIAKIGYKTVQVSGTCAYEGKWLDKQLKRNGLKCVLTHYNACDVRDDTIEVIKKHNEFGCKNIGLGCMPNGASEENLNAFLKDFKSVAEVIKENGSQLFYHNHHWEFSRCSDGELMIDKITKAFSPNELQITLDTYWAQYAGNDVCEVINKLSGRLTAVHLKDLTIVGNEQRMERVGYGNMCFEKIVDALDKAGTKYLLVEQDNCYGADPFECLKQSYEYLKSLGL